MRGWSMALLVPLVLLAGCIELVPALPPAARASTLQLAVRISEAGVESGQAWVRMTGTLLLGVDGRGHPQSIEDPDLFLLGTELQRVRSDAAQVVYEGEVRLPLQEVADRPLLIVPPRIAGVSAPAVTVHWPLLERNSPAALSTTGPQRFELSRSSPSSAAAPDRQRWALTLFRGGAWSSRGEEGVPPSILEIGPDLLPAGEAPLEIRINFEQSGTLPLDGEAYRIHLLLSQEVILLGS